jgi:hypothetical protein
MSSVGWPTGNMHEGPTSPENALGKKGTSLKPSRLSNRGHQTTVERKKMDDTARLFETSRSCYKLQELVKTDLETPFGPVVLTIIDREHAFCHTDLKKTIRVNRIEYQLNLHLHLVNHPDSIYPVSWRRNRSVSGSLLRRPNSNNEYYSTTGTNNANLLINDLLVPMICSFLEQNPEMLKAGHKVSVNNKLVELQEKRFNLLEEARSVEREMESLEEDL